MSSKSFSRPLNWVGFAAFAAAFWIALRVMAAVPPSAISPAEAIELQRWEPSSEIPDPALERLVRQLAATTPASSSSAP